MKTWKPTHLKQVAETYENLLVPALFEWWANHISGMLKIQPGQHVLDVACGTGVLARTIANRSRALGSITGLDANPAMLSVAEKKAPGIVWQEGKAEELPFEDKEFDVVVCQFGLMLFSSPKTALAEMNRVLRNNGHLILAVFDSVHNNTVYQIMAAVYERIVGKTYGDILRLPFAMGDTDKLQLLLSEAALTDAKISIHKGKARFSGADHMVLSDVKGWFPFAGIQLEDHIVDKIIKEAEPELEPFETRDGSIEFDVSTHIIRHHKK